MVQTLSTLGGKGLRNPQCARRGKGGGKGRDRTDQQSCQNGERSKFTESRLGDFKQHVLKEIGSDTCRIIGRHRAQACTAINNRQPIPDNVMSKYDGLSKSDMVRKYHNWLKAQPQLE